MGAKWGVLGRGSRWPVGASTGCAGGYRVVGRVGYKVGIVQYCMGERTQPGCDNSRGSVGRALAQGLW